MTVSVTDLAIAAQWLDCNEGDEPERNACRRVAEYLRQESERRAWKKVARENNIPYGKLIKRVKEQRK